MTKPTLTEACPICGPTLVTNRTCVRHGPIDDLWPAYECGERTGYERGYAAGIAAGVPREPTHGLLVSMAMRLNHGYGMDSLESRGWQIVSMRQVYEEIAGTGFYKPEREKEYAAMYASHPCGANKDDAAPRAQAGSTEDAGVAPRMNSEPGNPERDKRAMYRPAHQGASCDSAPANPDPIAAPAATPADDLVERCEHMAKEGTYAQCADTLWDAGNEVARLRAENIKLRGWINDAEQAAGREQRRAERAENERLYDANARFAKRHAKDVDLLFDMEQRAERAEAEVARLTKELVKERRQTGSLAIDLAQEIQKRYALTKTKKP